MNIKKYDEFKESILNDLSSKISGVYKNIKYVLFGNIVKSELKKYDIVPKKIDDKNYQFLNNDRVIAELKIDGMQWNKPLFKLTVYHYDSEMPNTKNLSCNKKFDKQEEQPYGIGVKSFFSTEAAINFLISYWSKYMTSGTNKNITHKIKL